MNPSQAALSWGNLFHGRYEIGAAFLCLFFAALPAQAASELFCATDDYRLPSGLRVILAPDPEASSVAVDVVYDVSSGDDPQGLSGMAKVVKHLMFGGSKHVAPGTSTDFSTAPEQPTWAVG